MENSETAQHRMTSGSPFNSSHRKVYKEDQS
jgi:hypothetical protein